MRKKWPVVLNIAQRSWKIESDHLVVSVVTLTRVCSEGGTEMTLLQLSLSRHFTLKEKEVRARPGGLGQLRGSFPF